MREIRVGGGKCVRRGWQLIWRLRKLRLGDTYFYLTWSLFLLHQWNYMERQHLGNLFGNVRRKPPNCVLIWNRIHLIVWAGVGILECLSSHYYHMCIQPPQCYHDISVETLKKCLGGCQTGGLGRNERKDLWM